MQTFNPGQIVARILVLQAAFYTSLALILAILVSTSLRAFVLMRTSTDADVSALSHRVSSELAA